MTKTGALTLASLARLSSAAGMPVNKCPAASAERSANR
jgi:hypothetical protein